MNTVILKHALKHGLGESEVKYAWESPIRCRMRESKDEPPRWIAIGTLQDGRMAELVAFEDNQGNWNVYHAKVPPTTKFLKELGFRGGKHGSH